MSNEAKKVRITGKQREEIDFLKRVYRVEATAEDEQEYLLRSVHGKGQGYSMWNENNPLLLAKRKLDIDIKMWREDLTRGLLSVDELKEDLGCPYGHRLVDSIIRSVDAAYRRKVFVKDKTGTALAFTNFPDVMEVLQE